MKNTILPKRYNELKNLFKRKLETESYRFGKEPIWNSIMELWLITIQNAQNIPHDIENSKKLLSDIEKKFNISELQRLIKILSQLLFLRPYQDTLGELYMELNLNYASLGQFFTPQSISKICTSITMNGYESARIEKIINCNGFITISDPCCGTGSMLLQTVKDFIKNHKNYNQPEIYCVGQELNRITAIMCYIQFVMFSVHGTVIIGDSLKNETRTVMHTPIRLQIINAIESKTSKISIEYKKFNI